MRNLIYDKIYRTSLDKIETKYSSLIENQKKIPLNDIEQIVQGTINFFEIKNFGFKDTIVKQTETNYWADFIYDCSTAKRLF